MRRGGGRGGQGPGRPGRPGGAGGPGRPGGGGGPGGRRGGLGPRAGGPRARRLGGRDGDGDGDAPVPEADDPWLDDGPGGAGDFDPEVDAAVAAFVRRTGVELDHRVPSSTEPGKERDPAESRVLAAALPHLEQAILVYPPSMRGRILQGIRIYGRFRLGGKPFLGSAAAGGSRINLAVRPRTPHPQLCGTLHHEIAHLVEHRPGFPVARWKAISGEDAYTGAGHRDAWGKGISDRMRQAGFVTNYASKNHHEDFAELAELAFGRPDRIGEVAATYPRLAAKLELLEAVYRELLPDMRFPWR
ncbi:MAG: hypothetical protein H6733_06515 [Alphaproteobacteria bacterium]|nr:hypothetical protein [Alphaproteobacteria bacterium]